MYAERRAHRAPGGGGVERERSDVGELRTPSLAWMLARELSRPDSQLPPSIDLTTIGGQKDNGTNNLKEFGSFLGSRTNRSGS